MVSDRFAHIFCFSFFSSKWKLISFLNLLFFGLALGVASLAGLVLPPTLYSGQKLFVLPGFVAGNFLLTVLFILVFNLVLSAVLFVTLPGFVFFPLSAVTLGFRAVLWGLLLYQFPLWYFLAALPTVVLEGEAYVLASAAGIVVGYSWLRPAEGQSRGEAFKTAFKQCTHVYALVAMILIVSAIVESATLILA
jgi:hypothetical protein